MWDIVKNPKKQLFAIAIAVACYWSYEVFITSHEIPVQVVEVEQRVQEPLVFQEEHYEMRIDTIEVDSDSLDQEPQVETRTRDEETYTVERHLEALPPNYIFWEMVLGHVASMLGSLVALLTPLITVFLNKKGYFKQEDSK